MPGFQATATFFEVATCSQGRRRDEIDTSQAREPHPCESGSDRLYIIIKVEIAQGWPNPANFGTIGTPGLLDPWFDGGIVGEWGYYRPE